MSVIYATCTFRNLTGFTLLPSKTSAPTLSFSPSAAVNSASKPHALACYSTVWLHVNQLAALSPSNTGTLNLMGDCTCCTAAVLTGAASGGLLAVCCASWNRVSWKSRLKTIRKINPLVIFPVKVRNSFQKQKVWASSQSLIFLEGKALFIRALNVCKKGAEFKSNHWDSWKVSNSSIHDYTGNSLCGIRKNRNFSFFVVCNGRNVVPSTIWGILTTKTDYLTLLAFLGLHPASHGKRGRCVILR